MIFGREPAFISAAVKAVITLVALTLVPLTVDQQVTINALVAALLGFYTSWQVARERALPTLVGVVEAALYVSVHFGLDVSQDVQAALLTTVGAVIALILRERVVAKIDSDGHVVK